jgi:hypothetical protein
MILTRTMTLEADLPDAPGGCKWELRNSDCGMVMLVRGNSALGHVSGIGRLWRTGPMMTIDGVETYYSTERAAAFALFAALGLEVLP